MSRWSRQMRTAAPVPFAGALPPLGSRMIATALAFAAAMLAGAAFAARPADAAKAKKITIKALYRAPSCPSGKMSMRPLPGAAAVVRRGAKTTRTRLNNRGLATVKLKGKGQKVRVRLVYQNELLEVVPYGGQRPHSFLAEFKLRKKKRVYPVRAHQLEDAGAASAWTVLREAAQVAKSASPIPVPKVTTRYDAGRGPSSGVPDVPGAGETSYSYATNEIRIDSRGLATEFEPWPLLHEYAHHLLTVVANPGPDAGGSHDLERSYPGEPAMAWSEGFAHAFAAVVLKNPVLGTLCRTGVNLSASPAVPRSKDAPWLNQYHEISIAGVVWGLVTRFGGGNAQAGLRPLLAALRAFHQRYGGPKSLREARDALIDGGLENGSAAEHVAIAQRFFAQGVRWSFHVVARGVDRRKAGSITEQEVALVLSGPYGTCTVTDEDADVGPLTGMVPPPGDIYQEWMGQIGATGGLPYTNRDDCLIWGGDGKRPYEIFGASMYLGFPYLAGQRHRSGAFSLKATWLCDNVGDEPEFRCTSERQYEIVMNPGPNPNFALSPTKVALRRGVQRELVRFDATGGECTFVPTGEDCGY